MAATSSGRVSFSIPLGALPTAVLTAETTTASLISSLHPLLLKIHSFSTILWRRPDQKIQSTNLKLPNKSEIPISKSQQNYF
jgi:hypothetical protein